jgi:hypothetical protein
MKHLLDMEGDEYDDPAAEERWCSECRQRVSAYLAGQGLDHGDVGEWPAWHVVPYVSVWAIESLKFPGNVGWWAICGDTPTDYVSAAQIKHPREAMRAFSKQWKEVSVCMKERVPHAEITIGILDQVAELAPVIDARAKALSEWAEDDSFWGPEGD